MAMHIAIYMYMHGVVASVEITLHAAYLYTELDYIIYICDYEKWLYSYVADHR